MSTAPTDVVIENGVLICSLNDVREHLNLWSEDDNPLLSSYLVAAHRRVENDTNRALSEKTIQKTQQGFPHDPFIMLRWGPVSSVDSVEYRDENGDWQVWDAANYSLDTRLPANVWRHMGGQWPATGSYWDAVRVTYTAGMDCHDQLYELARSAVLLLVAEAYENRQPVPDHSNTAIGRWSTYDAIRRQLQIGGWPGAYR